MLRPLASPTWASVKPRDRRQRRTSRPTSRRLLEDCSFTSANSIDLWPKMCECCCRGNNDLPGAKSQAATARPAAKESRVVNIAIIGTGNVGSALGQSLSRAGHSVTFYSRDEKKRTDAASANDAAAATSPIEAVENADVVILAVPYAAATDVAHEIASAVHGKVVIDTTNPLNADYSAIETKTGESAAEEIAAEMGDAHVVKAFNTVFAGVQADPGSK